FGCAGVKYLEHLGGETPSQGSWFAIHLDTSDRSFFQVNASLDPTLGDEASGEFAQIGIVSHHHDGFILGVLAKQAAKLCERGFGAKSRVDLELSLESHLVADKR